MFDFPFFFFAASIRLPLFNWDMLFYEFFSRLLDVGVFFFLETLKHKKTKNKMSDPRV